jgi:hypothetical protein
MRIAAAAVVGTLLVTGCADMTDSQQRMLTGTAGGAAGGAAIGAIAGNAALGAGIGAAAGLAGGYLWDQHKKAEQSAYNKGYQQGKKAQ